MPGNFITKFPGIFVITRIENSETNKVQRYGKLDTFLRFQQLYLIFATHREAT